MSNFICLIDGSIFHHDSRVATTTFKEYLTALKVGVVMGAWLSAVNKK